MPRNEGDGGDSDGRIGAAEFADSGAVGLGEGPQVLGVAEENSEENTRESGAGF